MKNHIDLDQLAQLNALQILTLSQNPIIDTVWADWQTEQKVQAALDVFRQKGMRHSTFIKTAEQCNSANLVHLLRDLGSVQVASATRADDSAYFIWKVCIAHPELAEPRHYSHVNLCDALWEAYVNHPSVKTGELVG